MKYAYFLNESNVVVNMITCENNVDTTFLDSTLELEAFSEASSYVVVSETNNKPYIGIGATYDGVKFTPKHPDEGTSEWSFAEETWVNKPFNSWIWNSETEVWEAPVPKPIVDNPDEWDWNESTQSWKEKVIFVPYEDFDEAMANGLAKRQNL